MGMITCPECGKRISDKATHCIGCGIGMDEIQKILISSDAKKTDDMKEMSHNDKNDVSQNSDNKSRSQVSILIKAILGVCIFAIVLICVLWCSGTLKRKGVFNSIYNSTGLCLSHDWKEADCENPKTCIICNKKVGEALGHTNVEQERVDADCLNDGKIIYKCEVCENISEEKIAALGHDWKDATCTSPQICNRCEEQQGEALGHTTSDGICDRCGKEIVEPIIFSGVGDSVIDNITFADGIYSVYFTNLASSNFIVHGYSDGENKENWVNEIGTYTGYILLNTGFDNGIIEVRSSGVWSICIRKITDEGTSNIAGHGNCVSPFFEIDSEPCIVHMENSNGSGNFIVHIYDEYGNRYTSLANVIGNYIGEKVFDKAQKGTKYCIEVESDGDWIVAFDSSQEKTVINNLENRGNANDSAILDVLNSGLSSFTYHTVEYSNDGTIIAAVSYTNTGRAFDEMLKGNSNELSVWNGRTKEGLLSISSKLQEIIRRAGYDNTVILRVVDDRDNETILFEASDGKETFCVLE